MATTHIEHGELINTSGASGIALDGYDPVAFFTDGKPMNGNPGISATHKGATYFFVSEEHRDLFEADPEQYLPQFGGYCASALRRTRCSPWISARGRSGTANCISISIRRCLKFSTRISNATLPRPKKTGPTW